MSLALTLTDREQAKAALQAHLLPYCLTLWASGEQVQITAEPKEDAITAEMRGYYHAVVLQEIADFVRPNGEQYPMPVWKEWFRDKFLGYKRVTYINPLTGRKSRRSVRKSTEDLGSRGYARLIDQVIAFAATDLNYTVSQPLPPHLRGLSRTKPKTEPKREHIDPDTGEITTEEAA